MEIHSSVKRKWSTVGNGLKMMLETRSKSALGDAARSSSLHSLDIEEFFSLWSPIALQLNKDFQKYQD